MQITNVNPFWGETTYQQSVYLDSQLENSPTRRVWMKNFKDSNLNSMSSSYNKAMGDFKIKYQPKIISRQNKIFRAALCQPV